MKIEALKGFCGVISMAKGEIRECSDEAVLADLLTAGYVKEARAEPENKNKTATKKGVKKGEGQ